MTSLQFHKFQGTGNDFIMVDNLSKEISLSSTQIQYLCNRNFGIGSDGLLLIEPSIDANFHANFYNPDGSQSFCGNGSRCAVRFAQQLGIVGSKGTFEAIDGQHSFDSNDEVVNIRMRDVGSIIQEDDTYLINTGSPHLIIYVNQLSEMDVHAEGSKIRYSNRFQQEGINVNFVQEIDGKLHIRTYERGVENETLSCGTGVTAAALSNALRHREFDHLHVSTRGGNLLVKWKRKDAESFTDIYLCGAAKFVYEGKITI